MAKSFKQQSFVEKTESKYNPDETKLPDKPEPEIQKKDITEPQRKVGRPRIRTEETRKVNIAVPVSVLKKLDVAKVCYSNSLTQYINKAIERDLEVNYSKYESIFKSLNDIG